MKKNNIKCLIVFIFLIIHFINYKISEFCLKCINDYKNSPKCIECSNELIFKGLNILSDDETVDEIINHNKSISRFGDGEYNIIFGNNIEFQILDKILQNKLLEVLNIKDKRFMVGIALPYQMKELNKMKKFDKNYWCNYFKINKIKIAKIIKNKHYYSAFISRFYIQWKDHTNTIKYIQKIKKIWEKRDILIIEGEKTRLGVGNNLFNNSKSIKRIICPFRNAFKVYNKIINEVLKYGEKRLILLSLGPTASVLAYDLYKLGYQSVDIGHVDIEYEWFLRKATHKIQIENKYVNEAKGNNYRFKPVKDKNYYNQIVAQIK